MRDKDRPKRLAVLARKYVKRALFGDTTCTYCGLPSDTWDHSPPVVWVYEIGCEWFEERSIPFLLVPACKQCNGRLGRRRLFTVADRAHEIYRRLNADMDAIECAQWTLEELDELGPRLRSYVEAGNDALLVLCRRIAWAERLQGML